MVKPMPFVLQFHRYSESGSSQVVYIYIYYIIIYIYIIYIYIIWVYCSFEGIKTNRDECVTFCRCGA